MLNFKGMLSKMKFLVLFAALGVSSFAVTKATTRLKTKESKVAYATTVLDDIMTKKDVNEDFDMHNPDAWVKALNEFYVALKGKSKSIYNAQSEKGVKKIVKDAFKSLEKRLKTKNDALWDKRGLLLSAQDVKKEAKRVRNEEYALNAVKRYFIKEIDVNDIGIYILDLKDWVIALNNFYLAYQNLNIGLGYPISIYDEDDQPRVERAVKRALYSFSSFYEKKKIKKPWDEQRKITVDKKIIEKMTKKIKKEIKKQDKEQRAQYKKKRPGVNISI